MGAKNARKKRRCRSKGAYPDAGVATSASIGVRRRLGVKVWAYRCEFCGVFHLGRPSRRVLQSVGDRKRAREKL